MGQFFTDFNGYTVGSQPAGTSTPWNGGSYTVNTGDLGFPVLRETHGGNAEYAIIWNHVPTTATDVEILFRGRTTWADTSSGLNYQMEAVLRGTGTAALRKGYTVNYLRGLYTNIEGYNNDGTTTSSFTLGPGRNLSWSAGNWYWLRARYEVGGGSTTTVRYKAWRDGTAEPGAWNNQTSDTTGEEYADSRFSHNGWIGISSYQGTGIRYYSQVGIGWNGDPAPSSMPSQFLGVATGTNVSGGSDLYATGTLTRQFKITSGTRDAVESGTTTNSAEMGTTTSGRLDGTKSGGWLFSGVNFDRGTRITKANWKFPQLANYSSLGTLSSSSVYTYDTKDVLGTNPSNRTDAGTAGGSYYNTVNVSSGRTLNHYPIAGTAFNDSASQWQTVGADVTTLVQEWFYSRMWNAGNTDLGLVIKGGGSAGNYIQPYHYDFSTVYGATLDITEAINTGYKLGSTVTTSTLGGTTWTSASSVTAKDGTSATTGSGSGGWQSDIIQVTGFNFNIPPTAVINGVTVRFKGSGSAAMDEVVRLIVGGTISGRNNGGGVLPSTTAEFIRGHAESTWNVALTAADVNASNFGIAYAVRNTSGGGSAGIDSIEVNVWYGENPKLIYTQGAINASTMGNNTGLPFYLGGHTYMEHKVTLQQIIQLKALRYWLAADYMPENFKTGDPETNFTGQPFQVGLFTSEANMRAWTSPVQLWTAYLKSRYVEPYDFVLNSTQSYSASTIIYIGFKLTGTAVNGFNTLYAYIQGLTDDANATTYFDTGGSWTSQAADPAFELYGVVIPPPILGDSLMDADSTMTVDGAPLKLGVVAPITGNSWLTNTIAIRGLSINQSVGGGSAYLPVGLGSLDPKFGTSPDYRVGQTFTPPAGTSTISGIGFQTYGISGTEIITVELHSSVANANANVTPLASKTVTLTDNYNEGTGIGTYTWYDAFFTTPVSYSSGSLFFSLKRNQGANNTNGAGYVNSDQHSGGNIYVTDADFAVPQFRTVPTTYNAASLATGSDLTFRVYSDSNTVGGASVDVMDADSSLTADGNRVIFGTVTGTDILGDSTFTADAVKTVVSATNSYSADSDITIVGSKIGIGVVSWDADSILTAVGNVGLFVVIGYDSDSTLTATGSKQFYGDMLWTADSNVPDVNALRTAITGASLSGDSAFTDVPNSAIEITHLTITKSYIYKIYDKNWNYLGIWDDVMSDFGYSQEINSAGSSITVTLARNSDTKISQYDSIGTDNDLALITDASDEIAAETETVNAIGPGTTVDLNLNVKIYEFSTDPTQSIEGDLVFTGYISMYTSRYGADENTDVSIFSYGADLDNWVLQDSLGNTRVPYLSKDPSIILKDTLDKFQAAGGLIGYDVGVPGATEVTYNYIKNGDFEVNGGTWTVNQGIGSRQTSGGGADGSTGYFMVQNMGGSDVSTVTDNLPAGKYRLKIKVKRPASGQINMYGTINGVNVIDFPAVFAGSSSWATNWVIFNAPGGYPLNLSLGIVGSDNVFYFDKVYLTKIASTESGQGTDEYFDGSTTDSDPDTTFAWTGTAQASTSTKTRVINNANASVENTQWYLPGWITTYTFNLNTELEVIKKCLELAPSQWYFYADLATNKLHFHPRPSTPAHYFYLGRHILGLNLEKTIEGITNDVFFTGGKPINLTTDRFNDVAGTDILAHVGELGATWVKHPNSTSVATLKISNANRLYPTGAGEGQYMTTTDYGSSNYEIEMDYYIATAQGDVSVMGRLDPAANTFYLARILGTSIVEVYKRIAGTYTLLQQQALPAGKTLVAGQTRNFKFKMEGAQLSVVVDGTTYIDFEDRSIIYGTRAGIRTAADYNHTNTTGMHIDNFQVRLLEAPDTNVFKRYTDSTSITNYRRGVERMQDNRVTLESSADVIAQSQIAQNNAPRYRSSVTIANGTYNIRSIKLGQLVAFRNFGNFIDDPANPLIMQIVRIDYKPDSVILQLDTLLPSVPKRLEEIKRNLNQEQVSDNPDAPDT